MESLERGGVPVGDGALSIRLCREGAATVVARAEHPSLRIEQGAPQAPLWGRPPGC